MRIATQPRAGDPRLAAFLGAATDAAASEALDALLAGEAERAVVDTVRRALSGWQAAAVHIEDVASDVRVRLMRKLWSLRQGVGEPIENFTGYAVTAAEHACYAFMRQQYPERTRFRNRVRYATSHHPATALERSGDGVWLCRTRRSPRRAPAAGATRAFVDDPRGWLDTSGIDRTIPLPALVEAVLERLDQPVDLDRFVDALAILLGIADAHPAMSRGDAQSPVDNLPDTAPGIGDTLQQRADLLRVWNEIVELPMRQRTALLLNLRDPDGGAVLQLLPATGVVSAEQIAAALGITGEALSALWERLPLDDLTIAGHLGLTRQQVINLRKSARARLARRMRGGTS